MESILSPELIIPDNMLEAGLQFFSLDQAATVDAITSRIIPGDAQSPGAREAHAVIYVDRALAGHFTNLQTLYREGLELIDQLATELFGARFAILPPGRQDATLRIAENAQHPNGSAALAQFFAVVWEHTIEGTFGDPIHGGNRDAIGWKMIGFPGAQWSYSGEQMAAGFDAMSIPPVTLAEIQRRGRGAKA